MKSFKALYFFKVDYQAKPDVYDGNISIIGVDEYIADRKTSRDNQLEAMFSLPWIEQVPEDVNMHLLMGIEDRTSGVAFDVFLLIICLWCY